MSNKIFLVIIGVLIIGFAIFIIWDRSNSNQPTDQNGEDTGQNSENLRSNNFYGKEDSQVVLIEAYSFACPACTEYHEGILKQLREEYQDRVRFQVVHFPLTASFGASARVPHRAAETAALQGQDKFWAMHDKIFESRADWIGESSKYPKMVEYAREIGLDVAKFEADYKKSEVNNRINNDIKAMQDMGATATPTFFINDEKIDNTTSFSNLDLARSTLDRYLAAVEEATEVEEETTPETDTPPAETEEATLPETN